MKCSEAVIKCLEMEGITMVFGYPGASVCAVYDSLIKSSIRHVLVRCEQNAGHSASGYARISGKPGVCIATSGPGATNLITAIATAYADSIPIVAFTGQVSADQVGRDVFQEADITGAAEPFVKHSYLISDPNKLPEIIKEAFYIAGSGRKGPVLIDIPEDILESDIDFYYPDKISIRSYKPTIKGNTLQVKRAAEAIAKAKKPLICAGGGVISAGASKELLIFAEKTGIPVVTTMMGKGAVSEYRDDICLGMIGMYGCESANKAVSSCDLIIIVGARVGDRAVKSPEFLQEHTKIIHIDIDPAEIGKNLATDIPIVGDAGEVLKQLTEYFNYERFKAWAEKAKPHTFDSFKDGYIDPEAFIKLISESCPENTVLVSDVGQNQLWTVNNFKTSGSSHFLTSGGMGTMGYALPAAIGAKLADDDACVIAVTGDGGFQMSMSELATAAANNINIIVIIMNNERLGLVREMQQRRYGRLSGVTMDGNPDFLKIAQAYGIKAMRISNISEANKLVMHIKENRGIILAECIIDPDRNVLQDGEEL